MKIWKFVQWPILLVMLSNGCATSNNILPTSVTLSASPTTTAFPTDTITPTPTPIDTVTPAPTPTLTSVPPLATEIARQKWFDLLANNGGCKLPCFWGITPGKSDYRAARSILMPLSGIANNSRIRFEPINGILGGWIELSEADGELHFNNKIFYQYSNDDIVTRIAFRSQEEEVFTDSNGDWTSRRPIYGLPIFIKRIEYYSLSRLLNEQGLPDSVMIQSSGPSINLSGSIFIHTAILYPNRGIWAEYTTLVNEDEVGDITKSCPINAHIEMNLYPVGNPDSFYALLEQTDWGITKNAYKPLEEATSMSLEQFYETFRQPTDKCIETPTKIWPTPER